MSGIFINYRRDDSAPYAGRLYDFLRNNFPNQRIFMDIDTIDPGEDFVETINKTLDSSQVVLAVIGRNWLTSTDGTGNRRLDNPDDYVLRELSAALASNARVIPVLVSGALMPRTDLLPPQLVSLTRRHAIEVSDNRFASDAERLVAAISKLINPTARDARGEVLAKTKVAVDAFSNSTSNTSMEDAMTTFKTVLWVSFGIGILSFIVPLAVPSMPEEERIGFAAFGIIVIGFTAWFNVMLIRGKGWARIAYLVLAALSLPALFLNAESQSGAEIALGVVDLTFTLWALRIMYTKPISSIYKKSSNS